MAVLCTVVTWLPGAGTAPPAGGVRTSESPVTTKCASERVCFGGMTSRLTRP